MRLVVFLTLFAPLLGCGSQFRPAVMPSLANGAGDPSMAAEQIAVANARPDPETRASLSKRARRVETAAAVAAAVVGIYFSKTSNVLLGLQVGGGSDGATLTGAAAAAPGERIFGPSIDE